MSTKTVFPKSPDSNIRYDAQKQAWVYYVRIRRDDGTTFKRAGSAKIKEEARRKRDLAYNEFNYDQGRSKDGAREKRRAHTTSIRDWADHCFADLWPKTFKKLTSLDAYRYNLNKWFLAEYGDRSLEDVTTDVLQGYVNRLADGGHLSAAEQTRSAVSRLYATAIRHGRATTNPAEYVEIVDPREQTEGGESRKERRRILSKSECERLIKASEGTVMHMPVLLGLMCGLRIGECLGLEWQDIDWECSELRVERQLQWVKGRGDIATPPKSKAGYRTIPIPSSLMATLRVERMMSDRERVCDPVLGNKKAGKYMRDLLKMVKLEDPQPTHHSLRGTYLTNMSRHMKPQDLKEIAGHGSVTVTMEYYVQGDRDAKRAAAETLSFAVGGGE